MCGKKDGASSEASLRVSQEEEMLYPQNFLLQTWLVVQHEEPWLDSVPAAAFPGWVRILKVPRATHDI